MILHPIQSLRADSFLFDHILSNNIAIPDNDFVSVYWPYHVTWKLNIDISFSLVGITNPNLIFASMVHVAVVLSVVLN